MIRKCPSEDLRRCAEAGERLRACGPPPGAEPSDPAHGAGGARPREPGNPPQPGGRRRFPGSWSGAAGSERPRGPEATWPGGQGRPEICRREQEERLRLVREAADLGVWRLDPGRGRFTLCGRSRALLGIRPESEGEIDYATFFSAIAPEDVEGVRLAIDAALDPADPAGGRFEIGYRTGWTEGSVRSVLARGRTLFDETGGRRRPLSCVGILQDVTSRGPEDQRRIEHPIRVEAIREQERRRIARELHDQLGQNLSALSLLGQLLKDALPPGSVPEARLGEVLDLIGQLSRDVHRLAWELRPLALDDLGLGKALAQHARQWSEWTGISVDFYEANREGRRVEADVESALYRIVQEALTNVARHARARHVGLTLDVWADHVSVVIDDDGDGFDVPAHMTASAGGTRLGVTGMRERTALVGGTLEIESAHGQGTTVFVRIPLAPEAGRQPDG